MTIARSAGSKKGHTKPFYPSNDAANDTFQICSLAVQFEKNALPIPVLSVYDGKESRVRSKLTSKTIKVRLHPWVTESAVSVRGMAPMVITPLGGYFLCCAITGLHGCIFS